MEETPPKPDAEIANPENNRPYSNEDITRIILAAISKLIHANRAKEKAEKKRTECREKWHFWLIFVEIGLVAVYAAVTVFEWRTFDSERKTMEEEFKASATNSQDQLRALQGQLDEMRTSRELDERAWVNVLDITNSAFSNIRDMQLIVRNKNAGRTPAIHVHASFGLTTQTNEIPQTDTFSTPHTDDVMPPGAVDNAAILKPGMLPVNIMQDIVNGKPVYFLEPFGMTIFSEGTTGYSTVLFLVLVVSNFELPHSTMNAIQTIEIKLLYPYAENIACF
jgi:hypothetical protein